jgi:hypothetical protein
VAFGLLYLWASDRGRDRNAGGAAILLAPAVVFVVSLVLAYWRPPWAS